MSRIVTFYSYKGGVGRTSALANVGTLLAGHGHKVLLIDCDLEAPGLHTYFQPYLQSKSRPDGGIINLLHEAARSTSAAWGSYVEPIVLPQSDSGEEPVTLDFIGTGVAGSDYAERVRTFSWQTFFEEQSGGAVIERWRNEWRTAYDFVLIDSRTGITDVGGVCTILLPDFLVLVFAANNQSFEGARTVAKGAQVSRRNLSVERPPLTVLPLPSHFDATDEIAEADKWLDHFAEGLKTFYDDWLPKPFVPRQILELTKIPYVTKFSFGEQLPALTHSLTDPLLPGFYYANVAQLLESDFKSAASIIDPRAAEQAIAAQQISETFDEMVLELTDLKFHDDAGLRRASARARLTFEPGSAGLRSVSSTQSWRFIAPIGPLEEEELRWYLEKYAIWPSEYFRERAAKVEENLAGWGRLLYESALPAAYASNVLQAWQRTSGDVARRFSVAVDATSEVGAPAAEIEAARECSTLLLGLPWELLHDGDEFLFQGTKPVRVRRRLPNTRDLDVPVVSAPIRILLVSPRPEDDMCVYTDHRTGALPLVEAMEALGGLVRIHVLNPPTLDALRDELNRADRAERPYHVVHFDGQGVFNRQAGIGGLAFEDPDDADKLDSRRHKIVDTIELGALLSEHRVPMVFLQASQTAQADSASESIASELLKVGVASVVAMSHSVLAERSRLFAEAFYGALARGARVGDAMLAGQQELRSNPFRGRVLGAGELRIEDWFVPVLFQEKDDPRLFSATAAWSSADDVKTAPATRLGDLPPEPEIGFVGRSRELLALQRVLRRGGRGRYAVIRGRAGEGKTALAVELARWMVRSQQVRRAAFVSVEINSTAAAALDALGRQLVPGYSVAAFNDFEAAIRPVERVLAEETTLVVVDNVESILAPPSVDAAEVLSEDAEQKLTAILALCARLNAIGQTRFLFTTRESLPAPFDYMSNQRDLHQLDREDAVTLVGRLLGRERGAAATVDEQRESIEQLVDAVHGHARTLALLESALRTRGVEATYSSLMDVMRDIERKFPGRAGLFANIELSLQRISAANSEHARVLAVFHGCVDLRMLRVFMEWTEDVVLSLARDLVETGLATADPYAHLTLHPALCPYMRELMDDAEWESLTARWRTVMRSYVAFLVGQHTTNIELAVTLTLLELPNLLALLDDVERTEDADATIEVATALFVLLQKAGRPRLLERVAQARDRAAAALGGTWSHVRFLAQRTRIEEELEGGRVRDALAHARELLESAEEAGESAYADADYDLAASYWLTARVLRMAGASDQALSLLNKAQRRFEAMQRDRPEDTTRMVLACYTERADCLVDLGRLDEAAATYEESLRREEQHGLERHVAIANAQLGTVRLMQRRYTEAIRAYEEARERFTRLDEPGTVATIWRQIGVARRDAGQIDAAEDAYRKSLAIMVQLGNLAGEAATLGQLGTLYADSLGRPEQAVSFLRQAIQKYIELGDSANEGRQRSNLAVTVAELGRFDEARQEIRRAIELREGFGHSSQPWIPWAILGDIERQAGNDAIAAEAKREARDRYLAYRRDGGENHDFEGQLCSSVTEVLRAGNTVDLQAIADRLSENPEAPPTVVALIHALEKIIHGSRDRALADDEKLDYSSAAEILFMIETLENLK